MMFNRAVIFGSMGKFGRVFCDRLRSICSHTTGVDVASGSESLTTDFINAKADLAQMQAAVLEADLVAVVTPEGPAAEIVSTLLPRARAECVAFDILSVKQEITRIASRANLSCNYVSVHPMFAPNTDFAGQNVILTEVCGDLGADRLESLFRTWGARTSRMTAAEHDNATALTQVACHAALLCFGLVCSQSELTPETMAKVQTPVSRILLAMSARIASGDPNLYQLIQEANAQGQEVRTLLAETMATINTGGQLGGEFADVFRSVNSWLSDDAQKYVDLASRLVSEESAEA